MKKALLSIILFTVISMTFGRSGDVNLPNSPKRNIITSKKPTIPKPHKLVLLPVGTPIFQDTVTGGSADPVIIWNDTEQKWFVYYTQRRANLAKDTTVAWMHGSAIGIASSVDGKSWEYRGICKGTGNIGLDESKGITWWAPDVTFENGIYHMFVSYVPGIFTDWMHPRFIKHFTSTNGLDWKYMKILPLSSENCIDPVLHKIENTYYIYYKDEAKGGHTWVAKSKDLDKWHVIGETVGDVGHEAPFVWQWEKDYYMIVDAWEKGLRIYKSENGINKWEYQNALWGSHPGILVNGDSVYMIYHSGHKVKTGNQRLTDLYLREIKLVNGKWQ